MKTVEYLRAKDQLKIYDKKIKGICDSIVFAGQLSSLSFVGRKPVPTSYIYDMSILPWKEERNRKQAYDDFKLRRDEAIRHNDKIDNDQRERNKRAEKRINELNKELKQLREKRAKLVKKMGLKED